MSTLIIVLRIVAALAFTGPMLVAASGRRGREPARSRHERGDRAPLVANLAAVGLYLAALFSSVSDPTGHTALLLAATGLVIAIAGVVILLVSRAELGPAWSFVPLADQGLVTTGPYRFVRHPIYLGLTLVSVAEALAFGSWLALVVALFGILPTFVWRARAEERLLGRAFGERYAEYRRRTSMIVPYVL